MTELERISFFYVKTKMRILELEFKKSKGCMTHDEKLELLSCLANKRATEIELKKHNKEKQ